MLRNSAITLDNFDIADRRRSLTSHTHRMAVARVKTRFKGEIPKSGGTWLDSNGYPSFLMCRLLPFAQNVVFFTKKVSKCMPSVA